LHGGTRGVSALSLSTASQSVHSSLGGILLGSVGARRKSFSFHALLLPSAFQHTTLLPAKLLAHVFCLDAFLTVPILLRDIIPHNVSCLSDLSLGSRISDTDSETCRGLGKKASLLQELGPPTIDVMRSIKRALDPHWLMNPGKIFEPTNEETSDEGATTAASTLGRPVEGH
jgi:hypothetical protein